LQRWRWSRCGLRVERGLGSSLPPTERASAGFRRFRGNKMPIFHYAESWKRRRTEVTEVTGRGHGLTGRVRSVQRSSQARGLGFATGAFGHSRDQSIRSGTQRNSAWRRAERTRGASGHTRSDASGHERSLLDSNRTLTLSRPVVVLSTSGRCVVGARHCAFGASGRLSSVSGHCI
jgi:hypothetical protein